MGMIHISRIFWSRDSLILFSLFFVIRFKFVLDYGLKKLLCFMSRCPLKPYAFIGEAFVRWLDHGGVIPTSDLVHWWVYCAAKMWFGRSRSWGCTWVSFLPSFLDLTLLPLPAIPWAVSLLPWHTTCIHLTMNWKFYKLCQNKPFVLWFTGLRYCISVTRK